MKKTMVMSLLLTLTVLSSAKAWDERGPNRGNGRGNGGYNNGNGGYNTGNNGYNNGNGGYNTGNNGYNNGNGGYNNGNQCADVERQTLDRVRADMRAEGTVRASSVGSNEQNCIENATNRANQKRVEAIDQCSSRATYFKSCEVSQTRIIQPASRIQPSVAEAKIDEKELAEARCKQKAQDKAAAEAIDLCQKQTGMNCRLNGPVSPATFKTEERRRYGFAGPKDDYSICKATAQALPDSNNQFQCSVEIVAQVRL